MKKNKFLKFSNPKKDNFFMPAEWNKNEAVWMLWPYRNDIWRLNAFPVQKIFSLIISILLKNTNVILGIKKKYVNFAKSLLPNSVIFFIIDSNDVWIRDTGPTIVINKKEKRFVIWKFNAWGGYKDGSYFNWKKDSKIPYIITNYYKSLYYKTPIILEAGSIHTDGEGTLLTTKECLLNKNRNPNFSKNNIENILKKYFNIKKIIWLNYGIIGDETNGHVDNICCFAKPGEVILHWENNINDPQHNISTESYEILSNSTDANGRKLKIWKLPAPNPLFYTKKEINQINYKKKSIKRYVGQRLAASYINFFISNNQIIFPLLDIKNDYKVFDILKKIFPKYKIYGIPSREILLGGGNIHCITKQIPSV